MSSKFWVNEFFNKYKNLAILNLISFNVRKEPTTPENIGKSILDGLKYVKE